MARWILGLTGGIGSGKTMATRYLEQQGIECIDADQIARDVVKPGSAALDAITAHFGTQVQQPDGHLNRPRLRTIIFSDPAAKQWLEALLHPLIQQETQRQLKESQSPYTVLASPLLFEHGQQKHCQRTLLIDAPEDVQCQRSMQRDGASSAQIEAIMQSQWTREQRQSLADDILMNDQDLEHLYQLLARLHQNYLAMAQAKSEMR